MASSRFKNVCCNPFNLKNHTGPKQRKSFHRVFSLILTKSKCFKLDDVLCAKYKLDTSKTGKDFSKYI